jgi:aldehyde dehydrogenase (NAD+)
MASPLRLLNYVAGRWTPAAGEATLEDRSPHDWRRVISIFPRSQGEDAHRAVLAAREAFPSWRRLSRIKRAEYLDAVAQMVKRDQEELALLMAQESGKPLVECRADVVEGLHTLQYWFGRARMPLGDVLASEIAEKDSFVFRKPKGVVVCITPWNFPFAIPLWLICPSLLEGNTVVLKPAEETPLLAHRIAQYFEAAGLPPGVLNVVHGYGEEVGWPLVVHPETDVVLFTGSYQVGSLIRQETAKDPRKFAVCEMGGKNAMVIFEDCDFDLAVNAAILAAFRTSGQRCVSASRLFVQEGILERFTQAFGEKARRLRIGDPTREDTFIGPLITPEAREKVERYNHLAKEEGAHVVLEVGRPLDPDLRYGAYIGPFVYLMEHEGRKRVLREEVFGPHVAIIPFSDMEDVIRKYNDADYAFALAVCTRDYRKQRLLREECDFGVGYVNLPTIGAEVHLPFGGLRRSGTGMPSAAALADAVSHRVSWTVNHGVEIRMAQGLTSQVP